MAARCAWAASNWSRRKNTSTGNADAQRILNKSSGLRKRFARPRLYEGQNIFIERRYGDPRGEQLRGLANELIKLKVDVILAWSTPVALAAQQATSTVPIVGAVMAEPVNDGLVARPGGNITGTSFLSPELVAKRLQLFREVIPKLSRVAALWHPHA